MSHKPKDLAEVPDMFEYRKTLPLIYIKRVILIFTKGVYVDLFTAYYNKSSNKSSKKIISQYIL